MSTESYNRQTLLAMLNNRIVKITYQKENGERRVLRGTLLDEYLPIEYRNVGITPDDLTEEPQKNLITLWDVDADDWRSIRTDRILAVL